MKNKLTQAQFWVEIYTSTDPIRSERFWMSEQPLAPKLSSAHDRNADYAKVMFNFKGI